LFAPFCVYYTQTSEIYTLSLHDALPIWLGRRGSGQIGGNEIGDAIRFRLSRGGSRPGRRTICRGQSEIEMERVGSGFAGGGRGRDRKSTRLNSSHVKISYAVFCLKKKNT